MNKIKKPKDLSSNPVMKSISFILTLCSPVLAAALWVQHNLYQAELLNVNTENAQKMPDLREQDKSIHRRLGNTEYLDLTKLLIRKSEVHKVPFGSQYFNRGNFYSTTNSSLWKYSSPSYNELVKSITGSEPSGDLAQAYQKTPVHLWCKSETLQIEHSSVVSNLAPMLTIQELAINDVKESVGLNADFVSAYTNYSTNDALLLSKNGPIGLATKKRNTEIV
jgi:hypothetical protein